MHQTRWRNVKSRRCGKRDTFHNYFSLHQIQERQSLRLSTRRVRVTISSSSVQIGLLRGGAANKGGSLAQSAAGAWNPQSSTEGSTMGFGIGMDRHHSLASRIDGVEQIIRLEVV